MTSETRRQTGAMMADAAIAPVHAVSLAERVVERLLDYIAANELAVGAVLPPQRDLAERLGVSRPVLRAALHRLEGQGIVRVRHGSGAHVAKAVERRQAPRLLDGFSHESALAVLEARMVIDVELAALAAERADEEDRQRLAAALERIRVAVKEGRPTVAQTSAFHQLIAQVARSPVLFEFYETLRLPMLANGRRIEHALPDVTYGEFENHRELYEALVTGDAEVARLTMREHLRQAHHWEDHVARLRGETTWGARQ
ncbi:MAG: FadR/GntR family transcriptional regulator [Thermomicrobiales bacterium]